MQKKLKKTADIGEFIYNKASNMGEYLFLVLMTLLSAAGRLFQRIWGGIHRRFGWLGEKLLEHLKNHGRILASPFVRYYKAIRMGSNEIRRGREKGFLPACAAGCRMLGRVLLGKRGLLVTLCNWALPIISCVFLFNIVSYANSMTYALKLTVNGEFMGYVED